MFLEKDEMSLYYEVKGQGQPLLLIHGVSVDSDFYADAAEYLQQYYQVITYDRRGYGQSKAAKGTDFSVQAQVEDVKDLLDALQLDRVRLVGTSAGAMIGLQFMTQYPERVEKALLYEPACFEIIMQNEKSAEWVAHMKDLISRKKINTALMEFVESIGTVDDRAPVKDAEMMQKSLANSFAGVKNEYSVFVDFRPDYEAMKPLADRITIAVGELSKGSIYRHSAEQLAEILGCRKLYFPGYHNLASDLPTEFAICVLGTMMI